MYDKMLSHLVYSKMLKIKHKTMIFLLADDKLINLYNTKKISLSLLYSSNVEHSELYVMYVHPTRKFSFSHFFLADYSE